MLCVLKGLALAASGLLSMDFFLSFMERMTVRRSVFSLKVPQSRYQGCHRTADGSGSTEREIVEIGLALIQVLKGIVHPTMKILSLITHPHVVPNP